MVRRMIAGAALLILLSACSTLEERGPVEVTEASALAETTKTINQPQTRGIELYDPANDETIKTFYKEEFGQEGEEKQNNLKAFANDLAQGEDGFDQRMQSPRLTEDGELEEGRPQVILDEEELVEAISTHDSFFNQKVELPLYITEPNISLEELEDIEETVIGQYSTYFDKYIEGRSHNIAISSDSIDRTVLGPEDTFSFNEVVGERTRERGYREANVIIDGDFVDGLGGGICQTSTTLYNTALEAGMDIVERNPHSKPVKYVPEGLDAMVSWGWADLRFSNPYDFPVIVRSFIDAHSGKIQVEIRASEENIETLQG
ncbi:VanW family protein [Salsuginibacillus kocurii]|uniref:VanW family protein n=1 Tax=Salsuginibacillus kocurii TaxID=427078 RepID=UPI00036777A7|nr:VanW family protein [Salsuginibacillus kocurii]